MKGKPHSECGRARNVVEKLGQYQVFLIFFPPLVQRPNQVILGTTNMSRENPTSHCRHSATLYHGCFSPTVTSVISCFYDTGIPSPRQVPLRTIIKQIQMFQILKHPWELLEKTYWSFGFQWGLMQSLKTQNAEKKLGFGSLKTSNFRVVLVTKSLAIFSQQRLCQVPHQRLICRADPPWAEDWCCCNGP